MEKQDNAVLRHIAAKLCDYHKDIDVDCGYCQKAMAVVADAFLYGKNGRLPLTVAELLLG